MYPIAVETVGLGKVQTAHRLLKYWWLIPKASIETNVTLGGGGAGEGEADIKGGGGGGSGSSSGGGGGGDDGDSSAGF